MKKILSILFILISIISYGQDSVLVKSGARWGNKKDTSVYFSPIYSAINSNTQKLKYVAPVFNIVTYGGADSTGVADATTAIRLCITAASYSGGTVFIPHGTFKTTDSIVITANNIIIMGEGESSKILASGDYGNIFSCHPASTPTTQYQGIQGIQFNNFYIESSTTRTVGSAIYFKYAYNPIVSNMRIGTCDWVGDNSYTMRIYNGVYFEYQSAAIVTGSQIYPTHYGVYFSGSRVPAAGGAVGLFYWDGLVTGNCNIWGKRNNGSFVTGSAGVYIGGGTGGVQIEQCAISFFDNGVKAVGRNRELFLGHAFAADDCGGAGIYIKDTLNILQMTGGWAAGDARGAQTPSYNLYIDSLTKSEDGIDSTAIPRINITGGTFYSSAANGVYIGTGRVTMAGVQIYSNATVANSLIFGGNVKAISIVGGRTPAITSYAIDPILRGVIGLNEGVPPTYSKSQSGPTTMNITNSSTGSGASANLQFNNSIIGASIGVVGAGYTTLGSLKSNTFLLNANGNGGLLLNAAVGNLRFSTSSSFTERMTIDSINGSLNLGNKFRANLGSAATGELVAGTSIDTYSGENLIFLASPAVPSTKGVQFGFYNGSAWKSMLEWYNVASGTATLAIGKTTGNVAIGATTATDKLEVTGNVALMTAGNKIKITEGSNGSVGQTTLVSGTKAITITGLTTSSRAQVTFVSIGGTVTTTWQYAAVCTANTLTITALTSAGATNTTDTSVLNYWIVN